MSHPNTMPEKRILQDQFGNWLHMTCIATYPMSEAASAARDKKGLMRLARSVHVMRDGDELHLYRATKDLRAAKDVMQEAVKI